MNFVRLRLPGFWADGSVVQPDEFEAIDDRISKTINAAEGSTHAPLAPIIVGGAGLWISGASRLDKLTQASLATQGTFTVSSGAFLNVASGGFARVLGGGRLDVLAAGELRVLSGGFINVQSGAALDVWGGLTIRTTGGLALQAGSISTFEAGSTINCYGALHFSNGSWPKLSPARTWERHSLRICNLTYDSASPEPDKPDAWIRPSETGGAECIQTRPTPAAGKFHWIELDNLPDGGTLTSVSVTTQGTSGTISITVATYQVVRWLGSAPKQGMSAVVTDVHTPPNWTTAMLTTTIPVTSFATIDRSYRYALIVFHPFQAGLNGAMRVYDVMATGTASEIRL